MWVRIKKTIIRTSQKLCISNILQKLQRYINAKIWHIKFTLKKNKELLICIRL